jgi:hypothetical protein
MSDALQFYIDGHCGSNVGHHEHWPLVASRRKSSNGLAVTNATAVSSGAGRLRTLSLCQIPRA